jgi:hypothetical protein
MLYQTKYGKTIEISVEQYLDMTDEELDNLDIFPIGQMIDDPWFGSTLSKFSSIEELDDVDWEDLTEVPMNEKIIDQDLDPSLLDD